MPLSFSSHSAHSDLLAGVVVENFSYVFQASGGGSKSVTREQMRAFKKIWREYANPKTGYLERAHFVEYLSVSIRDGEPDPLLTLFLSRNSAVSSRSGYILSSTVFPISLRLPSIGRNLTG